MKFIAKSAGLLGATWLVHICLSVFMHLGILFEIWEFAGIILAIVDSVIVVKYMKNEKENCEKDGIPVPLAYLMFIIIWIMGNGLMAMLAPVYGMMVSGDPGHAVVLLAAIAIGVIPLITLVIAKIVLSIKNKIS
jgi:hypothetical protein